MADNGPWLCVEVVGARNLESKQAVDAYCVLRVGAEQWRSVTAPSASDPRWVFCVETQLLAADGASDENALLALEIFNEKNFFFDMFPTSGDCRHAAANRSASTSDGDDAAPTLHDRRRRRRRTRCANGSSGEESTSLEAATSDEALGVVEISLAMLKKRAARGLSATDEWHLLRGTRSGEVRVRTLLLHSRPPNGDMAARWNAVLYDSCAPREDHYGFRIPDSCVSEWTHLRSYQACREQRRVTEWETTFGSHFFTHVSLKNSSLVRRLAHEGVPRHWRQRVYMAMTGALEKQQNAPSKDYYASLVRLIDTRDSTSFRQIELDIDRTFGHSGTKMSTDEGRAMLRRVLKAYSMHNPAVGYCQGLNFIVGFLVLLLDEESTFWLLAVICEDMFPGYYIPTMADTQTDMLVLKQLIADELPKLDEFTSDVGLPLELLGSQWLLCLFTTTFPAETVFRIFDCIVMEGPHFVFSVIMTHLRRLESKLLGLDEFQAVLSTMKDAENALLDADTFIREAVEESEHLTAGRIARLRQEHSVSVQDEMERADRARALNRQLAVVYQIPAFSGTAASLLRFFHEEAEMSARSDVAFVLTLLCHGLVWLAEHSKRLRR